MWCYQQIFQYVLPAVYNSYPCYMQCTNARTTNPSTISNADTNPQINTSYRVETPWKRKTTAPHATSTSACHSSLWRGFFPVTSIFYFFCIPEIRSYRTKILPLMVFRCSTWALTLQEQITEGCFTARTRGRYLGLRWINRKVEKMAQGAWVLG
jgi:hypothetical protein